MNGIEILPVVPWFADVEEIVDVGIKSDDIAVGCTVVVENVVLVRLKKKKNQNTWIE